MFNSFIKYFFILIIAYYFFAKLLGIKTAFKQHVYHILFSAIFASLICITRYHIPHITILMLFITSYVQNSLSFNMPFKITLTTSLLSLGLSYFAIALSSIIITPLSSLSIFTFFSKNILYIILFIIIGIFQCIIAFLIFRVKRLRNGMPFLLQKVPVYIGIVIGCFILVITSILTVADKKSSYYRLTIIICITATFLLFIWWRKQLSITYINKAHKNELERLNTELVDLRENNERMGAIIHKDNKLISAMLLSVENAISKKNLYNAADNELEMMLCEIKKIYNERCELATKPIESSNPIIDSSFNRIDMMLNFMHKKAIDNNITLNVKYNLNIGDILSKDFTEDSLVTIVADLVENAIIATKLSDDKKDILIDFTKNDDINRIDVYDTGIPFEPYTIQNAGIKKASTHLDTGGSGIGLMSTFSILRICGGSFEINETIENTPYSKRVSIVLDSLNQYRVYSKRPEIHNTKNSNPNINIKY